jgi:hypothetical protein
LAQRGGSYVLRPAFPAYFFFALGLQFSVRLSRLTHRNRTLAQRLALLEQDLERLHGERHREPLIERPRRQAKDTERDEVA